MPGKTRLLPLLGAALMALLCGCEAIRSSKIHPPATAERVDRLQSRGGRTGDPLGK